MYVAEMSGMSDAASVLVPVTIPPVTVTFVAVADATAPVNLALRVSISAANPDAGTVSVPSDVSPMKLSMLVTRVVMPETSPPCASSVQVADSAPTAVQTNRALPVVS